MHIACPPAVTACSAVSTKPGYEAYLGSAAASVTACLAAAS